MTQSISTQPAQVDSLRIPWSAGHYAKVLAKAAEAAPALIIICRKSDLGIVYLNGVARQVLDPEGHADLATMELTDFMGVNSVTQMKGEMLLHAGLMGRWKGVCALRDIWGSEISVTVSCTSHVAEEPGGVAHFCLQAIRQVEAASVDIATASDQELLHALLETLPDSIYFKDLHSRFIRVNQALANKNGLESPIELIGLTDFDRFTIEHAQQAYDDEQRIIRTGKSLVDVEEKETWPDGRITWVSSTKIPLRNAAGHIMGTFGISRDVTERKRAEESMRLSDIALKSITQGVFITDHEQCILSVNDAFKSITGYDKEEVIGQNCRFLQGALTEVKTVETMRQSLANGTAFVGEILNYRNDGTTFWNELAISPVRDGLGRLTHFIGITRDISARKKAEQENSELLVRLQLAQKLESIGRLAAGVAHEINTPTQFITDNAHFLIQGFAKLAQVLHAAGNLRESAGQQPQLAEQVAALVLVEKKTEIDYLLVEIPNALNQSLEGLGRVARIVQSLKEFSHPQNARCNPVDLNHVITTAITVSRHEWKYVAEVVTDFSTTLPPVPCVVDEFNQVILNLLVNAAHAIDSALKIRPNESGQGRITVRTRRDGDWALVEIEDSGTGIPDDVLPHIFEPFFTTKDIGKGTGQGLAIVHNVIVKNHQGTVNVTTTVGLGTTFHLRLPLTLSTNSIHE